MEQIDDITAKAINDWYDNLSKREKLIVLSIHNMEHSDDFTEIRNVELVLMAGIEPRRRYVENGVPCVDYPSFDEITDVELYKMWNLIPINDKLQLYKARC